VYTSKLRLKHIYILLSRNVIERVNQYFKGRTKKFDDYSIYQKLMQSILCI